MRLYSLIALTALLLATLGGCQKAAVHQQRFLQFGTLIDVTLSGTDSDTSARIFDDIEQLLVLRHSEWHGWQDGTLKRFNRSLIESGEDGVEIPPTLALLIKQSKQYYQLSGGLFNPAMGKLIDAWGFHSQHPPDQQSIAEIKENLPGMHQLRVDGHRAYAENRHLQLDFGAIAKGLAVQQIADLIRQHQIRDFIVNAGGDIYAEGNKLGKRWRIAIENPFMEQDQKTVLGSLQVTEALSIFTSGNYRRFYLDKDNTRRHHIIDPQSGEPSLNISAVTVVHADPTLADIAATTLMLTAPDQLKSMADRLGIKDFLAITEQHELFISQSLMDRIEWLQPLDLKIHPL